MILTIVGVLLFLLMAVAALPLPKVRQAVLTFAARAGLSGVLAAVAACGTLFVKPNAVPELAQPYAQHVTFEIARLLPEPAAALPGIPWLVLAAVIVALSLPVLSLVEFAARVMGQTAVVQALRKELRAVARGIDQRLATLPDGQPALTSELAAAAEAMRTVSGDPKPAGNHPHRPKLVLDLLQPSH